MFKLLYRFFQSLSCTWQQFMMQQTQPRPVDITDPMYFTTPGVRDTLQYPQEKPVVPPRGRYKLHNHMDDCIVCNRCAKVCPVNCIDIVSIRSPTVFGYTSNGRAKRIHAAKFAINLAQCCFCDLCTTVCPTKCLTMTPVYDYSVFDVQDLMVSFETLTPQDIAYHGKIWQQYQVKTEV